MKVALLGDYPLIFEELDVENPPRFMASWVSLAKGLASLEDTEIHFVSITPFIARDRTICSDNVTVHFLKYPRRTAVPTLFQYNKIRIHRKLRQIRPDIVHGHGTEFEYAYDAITSGFPAVITVHNVVSELLKIAPGCRLRILSYFEKYTLRKAKHIIGTSPWMEASFGHLISGRFYVIDNSINEVFFDTKPQAEDDGLLFVGRIVPDKGLMYLLQAIDILKHRYNNVLLKIIGHVPTGSGYHSLLIAYIQEHNLLENVKFLGYEEPEGVAEELSRSIALVLPSIHEPFGNVLAEAMAIGKPVVATKVGGIPYVVEDGETALLVDPGNGEALAEKIAMLLESKELRMAMGKKGKQQAIKRFHPEIVARKTRAIYEQVLSEW